MSVRSITRFCLPFIATALMGLTACGSYVEEASDSTSQAAEKAGKKITDNLPPSLSGGSAEFPIDTPIGNTVRVTWGEPDPKTGKIPDIKIEIKTKIGFWKTVCDGGTIQLGAGGLSFDCNWKFPASQFVTGKIAMDGEWVFPFDENSDGYIPVIPTDADGQRFPPVVVVVEKDENGMKITIKEATLDDKGNLTGIGKEIGTLDVPKGNKVGLAPVPKDDDTKVVTAVTAVESVEPVTPTVEPVVATHTTDVPRIGVE